MKLLYITNGINGAGGLERVLSIKASYLADVMGYEVHILGLNRATENLFYTFSSKIKLHSIPVGGNPISYFKSYCLGLKAITRLINPDIVIVCDDGLKAFFLPTILGKSKPIIYERHVSKNIEIPRNAEILKTLISKLKFKLMDILAPTFTQFVSL